MEELIAIYSDKEHTSLLIFPKTRKTKTKESQLRISEQEAIFLVARELEAAKIFYSVEAPTRDAYYFQGPIPIKNPEGSSGSIDLCVHSDSKDKKRKHLIEFKAHSPKEKTFSKDFLKLKTDDADTEINYFVHIIYQCEKRTINSIIEKYKKSLRISQEEHPVSRLKICVCLLGKFPENGNKERIFFFDEGNVIDKFTEITEEIYGQSKH